MQEENGIYRINIFNTLNIFKNSYQYIAIDIWKQVTSIACCDYSGARCALLLNEILRKSSYEFYMEFASDEEWWQEFINTTNEISKSVSNPYQEP